MATNPDAVGRAVAAEVVAAEAEVAPNLGHAQGQEVGRALDLGRGHEVGRGQDHGQAAAGVDEVADQEAVAVQGQARGQGQEAVRDLGQESRNRGRVLAAPDAAVGHDRGQEVGHRPEVKGMMKRLKIQLRRFLEVNRRTVIEITVCAKIHLESKIREEKVITLQPSCFGQLVVIFLSVLF